MYISNIKNQAIVIADPQVGFLEFALNEGKLVKKYPLPTDFYSELNDWVPCTIDFISHNSELFFAGFTDSGFKLAPVNLMGERDLEGEMVREYTFPEVDTSCGKTKVIYKTDERTFGFSPTAPYIGIANGAQFLVFDYMKERFIINCSRLKANLCVFSPNSSKVMFVRYTWVSSFKANQECWFFDLETKEQIGHYSEESLVVGFLDDEKIFSIHDDKIILWSLEAGDLIPKAEMPITGIGASELSLLGPIKTCSYRDGWIILNHKVYDNKLFLVTCNPIEERRRLFMIDLLTGKTVFTTEQFSKSISLIQLKAAITNFKKSDSDFLLTYTVIRDCRKDTDLGRIDIYKYSNSEIKLEDFLCCELEEFKTLPPEQCTKKWYSSSLEEIDFEGKHITWIFSESDKEYTKEEYHQVAELIAVDRPKNEIEIKGFKILSKIDRYIYDWILNNISVIGNKVFSRTGASKYLCCVDILEKETHFKKLDIDHEVFNTGFDPLSKYLVVEGSAWYPRGLYIIDAADLKLIDSFACLKEDLFLSDLYGYRKKSFSLPLDSPSLSLGAKYLYHAGVFTEVGGDTHLVLRTNKGVNNFFAVTFTDENSGILYCFKFAINFAIEKGKLKFSRNDLYNRLTKDGSKKLLRMRYFYKRDQMGVVLYNEAMDEYEYALIGQSDKGKKGELILTLREMDIPYRSIEEAMVEEGRYKFTGVGSIGSTKNSTAHDKDRIFQPDMDVHPSGDFLVLSSRYLLQFHSLKDGQCLAMVCLPFYIEQIHFTEDGRHLVCANGGSIIVFHLERT